MDEWQIRLWGELNSILQKCVASRIKKSELSQGEWHLEFDLKSNDTRLHQFAKFVGGKWRPPAGLRVTDFSFLTRDFVSLLDLTHLAPEKMQILASCDARFQKWLANEHVTAATQQAVSTVEQTKNRIFQEIKKQKLTLREVAERSGMTQMALHNYKKGTNIRLNNFLSLLEVLNVKMVLESKAVITSRMK